MIFYLWYNSTDLISVLTMLYWEQKYTRIITIISCTYLLRTKIYWQEQTYIWEQDLNNLMLHKNSKMVWTGVNGHNLDTECNNRLCCGPKQKNWSPQMFPLCIQQQQKYMLYWNNIRGKHEGQWWLVSKKQNMEEVD